MSCNNCITISINRYFTTIYIYIPIFSSSIYACLLILYFSLHQLTTSFVNKERFFFIRIIPKSVVCNLSIFKIKSFSFILKTSTFITIYNHFTITVNGLGIVPIYPQSVYLRFHLRKDCWNCSFWHTHFHWLKSDVPPDKYPPHLFQPVVVYLL